MARRMTAEQRREAWRRVGAVYARVVKERRAAAAAYRARQTEQKAEAARAACGT